MNNYLLKKILNVPYKKCRLTKIHYPMTLMTRLIQGKDCENNPVYLPDNMYTNFEQDYFVFCDKDIFHHFTQKIKHPVLPYNMTELVLSDLAYCNRILLRKLISNNYYSFDFDFDGNSNRNPDGGLILISDEDLSGENYANSSNNIFLINSHFHFKQNETLTTFLNKLIQEELNEIIESIDHEIKIESALPSIVVDKNNKFEQFIEKISSTNQNSNTEIKNLIDFYRMINSNNLNNHKTSLYISKKYNLKINILSQRLLTIFSSNILKYNYLTKNKYFPY